MASVPTKITDLTTPCFLVDLNTLKRNVSTMRERCEKLGIQLRPHMKTSKTIEAGVLALGGSKRKICVSTLAEAEFFAKNGFDDILYAMLFSKEKLSRINALVEQTELFHVAIDSEYGIKLLDDHPLPKGRRWSVFLLVNTGCSREGSLWSDGQTLDLGRRLFESSCICFRGLYTHEGQSYDVTGKEKIQDVCNETVQRITHVANKLREMNVEFKEVTIGATPTASVPGDILGGITEFHPGNYVYYDCQQNAVGSCQESDIACRVATRIIGQYPDRAQILVDAGWSAVGKDGPLKNGSYGKFQGYPHLKLVSMNQEYGFVQFDEAHHMIDDFPHGLLLYLYPYHSCNTAMCHKQHYVHDGDVIIDKWLPCSQW